MTNSNFKTNNFITPEKAAILLPTIISSFISFIIISAFAIPKYVSSNKVNNELKEFRRKESELPELKLQSKIISEKLKKLNIEKRRIIKLISGTKNLDTFITRLGFIGNKNNINFKNILPISSTKFVGSGNSEIQNELNINPDPLLVEGVKKYIIDVKFSSDFSSLLSFFRELELQENIILFSDINVLTLKAENENTKFKNPPKLEVSLKMIVYGKI